MGITGAGLSRGLAAGTLPKVSWIVPAAHLSEHPAYVPPNGENITAKLIEALVDHPEMFAKTAFIMNYDENGGMLDYTPTLPPADTHEGNSTVSVAGEIKSYEPGDVENHGKHPIGLGLRAPAIIVSPRSRGGWVCSEVFDHVSTLRFLEARFGVKDENSSDWRRAVSGILPLPLTSKIPTTTGRSLTLPDTAGYLARVTRSANGVDLSIPEVQEPTSQDTQQRRAQPLPYELQANGCEDATDQFFIEFVNTGKSRSGISGLCPIRTSIPCPSQRRPSRRSAVS